MSAENEAYLRGCEIERSLSRLRGEVLSIDASDTGSRERAVRDIEEARRHLKQALAELSRLV